MSATFYTLAVFNQNSSVKVLEVDVFILKWGKNRIVVRTIKRGGFKKGVLYRSRCAFQRPRSFEGNYPTDLKVGLAQG